MKKMHIFLWVCLLSFASRAQTSDSIPVHDNFTLASTVLNETRTITVWTPPGYSENNASYPVLYMLDGGIKEDFPHIANTLAKLIASESIPPMILVGIENTQRRRDLTGPTEVKKDKKIAPVVGGSEAFRSFIHTELFAEIAKRYRVTGERGIIGESLAGLFVVETFLLQPDLFDFYIAFDPSLWWNKHHLVKTAKMHLANLPPTQKRLWFAGSSAKDIFKHTRALEKVLTDSAPKTLRWTYSDEPNEQHSTIFRATKEKAFIWSFSESVQQTGENHIFFLHNKFIENNSLETIDPRYGKAEYEAILASFRADGFEVHSEKRAPNTDVILYARNIVTQIDSLIASGVEPSQITVIGTSKGGYIAQYVSTFAANPQLNFVFIGCYMDGDVEELSDIQFCGNILTIYEKTDPYGVSALKRKETSTLEIPRFREIELNTALNHGFLYKALDEWIEPCKHWARRQYEFTPK